MISGFRFNRIVIIQSLEATETQNGDMISNFIKGEQEIVGTNLPVEVINCSYAAQFIRIVQQLTTEAAAGSIPLLHVECHGDAKEGLEFENGSMLSWEKVAGALLPLNIASGFNLLSVFSACFGAHFLGQMGVISAAPCWCMVAPTETVDPSEIFGGFCAFYSTLFRRKEMGSAVKEIARRRLTRGRWFSEFAEVWFETVVTGYVEDHCIKSAARERAKKIFRKLKEEGKHESIGRILRHLRDRNRRDLLGEYFNTYFITDRLPENSLRFENAKLRVMTVLSRLRSTGQYIV